MSKRLLTIFGALFVFSAIVTVLAQAQSQGTPSYQPASSGLENQGVRRYRIGPGDLLDVRVFGQSDLNSVVEIDEDGNISSLPFIEEPIPAKCRNEREIQKSITDAYGKYLLKPRVSVRVLERRSRAPAVVFGAVRSPTRVPMVRRLRLHEILATAGGITANASGTIQIVHTEPELCPDPEDLIASAASAAAKKPVNNASGSEVAVTSTADKNPTNTTDGSDVGVIDTYKISGLKSGGDETDPFIRAGDIVIVTEGEPVFITGMVVTPREVVVKDNLTLVRALAMAGGPQKMAKTSEILIYRKKDGKIGNDLLKVNYDAIRKGQQPDVVLQPYDIIDVRPEGTFSARGIGEILKGLGTSSLGTLPLRMPIPF